MLTTLLDVIKKGIWELTLEEVRAGVYFTSTIVIFVYYFRVETHSSFYKIKK